MISAPNLIDLAASVADGTPIDWDRLESQSPDPVHRAFVCQLRLVEGIAKVHGTPRSAGRSTKSPRLAASEGEISSSRETPTTWGPFTVLERVGRGTFGDVYRALDPRLDRPVALKLLRRREKNPDALESAVIEEARLMARVKHPNVVTIHGAERIDGRVGLWMEFIDGRTLEEELREHGPFDAAAVAAVGHDLCGALEAVHEAGLLHRDLKAQNVIRDRKGHVRLTDFGTGLQVSDSGDQNTSGELAGTPLYLAPEVLNGDAPSARSDVYSLGVLLYHLATGSFPVRGRSVRELRDGHAGSNRTSLRELRIDVPWKLAETIDRACHPDPAERYPTATEFAVALRKSVGRPRLVVGRLIATAVLVLVASIAAAGVWMSRQARVTPAHRERDQQGQQQVLAPAIATIDTKASASPPIGVETEPAQTPQALLRFRPRDLVLVTRFENRTGEPVFDGALEYAFERELSNSDVIGLVSRERVEDALGLMKRAADTVVDRTVGREVALRDGHVKALLAGRVEKFGTTYVLTAQLVDPADDAIVATVTEEAIGLDAILAALYRQALRVRISLGEHRDRIKGADPTILAASTRSLKAFQLFNQADQLMRQGRGPAAREIARQVVEEDPEFGSGWIQLAWAVRNTSGIPSVGALGNDPVPPEVLGQYRPYLDRALELSKTAAEWERYWILGSYYTLLGDRVRAQPMFEALVKLRPDHYLGVNRLFLGLDYLDRPITEKVAVRRQIADQRPNDFNSNYKLAQMLVAQGDGKAAKGYIDRAQLLLTPELATRPEGIGAAYWLQLYPAFVEWERGDIRASAAIVAQAARKASIESSPKTDGAPWFPLAVFYISLGQVREATQVGTPNPWPQLVMLDLTDNVSVMRQFLLSRFNGLAIPYYWIKTGLLERAADLIDRDSMSVGDVEHGRGDLALLAGRPGEAIPHLQQAVAFMKQGANSRYYLACQSLVTAFERVESKPEALKALEDCAAVKPGYVGSLFATSWMKLRLRLADEYRKAGQVPAARRIEQDLRNLLVLADEDFPLVLQLKNRR